MTESTTTPCPRCGTAASGNFCAACGSSLGDPACAACGTTVAPDARFCHRCGKPLTPAGSPTSIADALVGDSRQQPARPIRHPEAALPRTPRNTRDTMPWVIAAVLTVVTIASVAYAASHRSSPEIPSMANAGNGGGGLAADSAGVMRAPNIDSLSPKERFVRLDARVDQMVQTNDTTQVAFFMQMALQAYAMLPPADRDSDVRFHAAMLQAQLGMFENARALADSISAASPDNLLADYVRAIVAEFAGDSARAQAARADFRKHYDTEIKKPRPEYQEHLAFLQQYRNGDGAH